ncbi:class B sortase [Alkalihalobacillus trypoxylicola]|uniref:SrtB family sortase n=1 Tax=Alkalihalobacillus trypoxylicola TaxID=519424 RepID=A0A162DE37_9BACI|nr:class B sortase [Alkalihalobacillus trypoxylicola]KYG29336.1 SrtB family sortase [Alkalihalobacillus trypoxylicola]
MSKKNNNPIKWVIQKGMTVLCALVFVFSFYYLSDIFFDYYQNRQVLADIQEVYEPRDHDKDFNNNENLRKSFDPLLAINKDIVGWISIDNTRIDYPILQSNDNDYYLNRNYLLEESRAGSIFMDFRNDISELGLHTILYGHRMKDGTMFADLKKYLQQDYYEENRYFYFDTLYDSYEIEIFSAYTTTTDFYYIETNFEDQSNYLHFIEEIQAKSMIKSEVTVEENEQIITLSTCDYALNRDQGRLVVHGKIVPSS